MGDETDEGESWEPEVIPDIPVSEQEKLKLELMKLNEQANVSIAPKGVDPAKIEALKDVVKGSPQSLQNPMKPASPAEKPVEAQTPPQPEDAPSIEMSPDTPMLNQPSYEPTKTPNIRMLSTEKTPGKTFSPEVERSLDIVSKMYPNVPREVLAGFVQVESGGNPRSNIDRNTQYKGLLQIGREEWRKHGGGGDIYDAEQNLKGGASLMEKNRQDLIRVLKREPTPAELYLAHQQGLGFFTRGATTNLAGNLPPSARTAENLTHDGFARWWTARINRAIAERGSAASMSKAEPNLPDGFLYPGGFADVGGKELTKGGGVETPEQQAMIAELMRGAPLATQKGTERATNEAIAAAKADPRLRAQVSAKVPLSREQIQVQGALPQDSSSVSHTEPQLPIPGITTPGQQALIDATNPTMASTIQQYQSEAAANAPPPPPVAEMRATPQSFVQKLMSTIKGFATPQGSEAGDAMRRETIKELLNKEEPAQGDWAGMPGRLADVAKAVSDFDQRMTKGVISGVQSQPGQLWSGVAGPAATIAGQLSGHDPFTKWGIETQMAGEPDAKAILTGHGGDPNDPVQSGAFKFGENVGPNLAKTLYNLAMGTAAEQVVGPASEWAGKNYPIPNINPISSAHAGHLSDAIYGAPPLVVNTPGGPVIMNRADVSQYAYGGIFAIGFGAAPSMIGKGVRYVRSIKPDGLNGIFDPRGEVPGAHGTEAASLPIDKLKAGSLDPGTAMRDIADRQARYEKGTAVGLDPIAANEVLQQWRVQTNAGAQNLVKSALEEGELTTKDYRFQVNQSIGKLVEYSKVRPEFPEYLRLKIISDEIQLGIRSNRNLPLGSTAQRHPTFFEDPTTGNRYDIGTVGAAISRLETQYPEFVNRHLDYRDNLDATREFVSSHQQYNIQDPHRLNAVAIDRPSMPIFAERQQITKLWDDVLAGDNPLALAETHIKDALEAQMRFDAEQRYIKMTRDNVGTKAFTRRTQDWVDSYGSRAEKEGAILTRTHRGETIHYTADPLLVSIMNSGHIPLSGIEQTFAGAKSVFQKTTTGAFAPWFAPTGMIRAMEQGWTTAPGNVRNAQGGRVLPSGPLSTAYGFMAMTGAKMARPTAQFFRETMVGTALNNILTGGQQDLIARTLEKAYMDSFYRRMAIGGAFSGDPIMEGKDIYKSIAQMRQVHGNNPQANPIITYMETAQGFMKNLLWNPLKNTLYTPLNAALTSMQEAPAYGWAYKVGKTADDTHRPTINGRAMSDAELATHMRNYTGDPSTRGYAYDKNGKPLRFLSDRDMPNRPMNVAQEWGQHIRRAGWKGQDFAYQKANAAAHWGRSVTPWAGVLFQSPSATLAAMRDNPWRANIAFAASAVMPEITAYLWNSYWSDQLVEVKDANGQPVMDSVTGKPVKMKYDYVNHMMNMRNEYNTLNNTYFAVPGAKPNEGMEFRQFQETVAQRYMTRAFMQQYAGKAYGTMGDDVGKALNGFLGAAVIPPLPPALGAYLGSKSLINMGGLGGTIFRARSNPYIELGGGESPVELVFRGIAPGLTDVILQAHKAGTHAETWGDVPSTVVKQVGKRVIGRTAFLSDLTRFTPDATGTTVQSDELWANKKTIDDLSFRFRMDAKDWAITVKGSKEGKAFIADDMPKLPPSIAKGMIARAGLPQPEPKNPLYKMLMQEIVTTFSKDQPKKGGIGFKSMWGYYQAFGQLVSGMRTVDDGNTGWWIAEQLADPERMQWLRENNVNPLKHKEVRDYYQVQRNKVTKKILETIKATEQKINQRPEVKQMLKGKKFSISMIDPDEPGITADRAADAATNVDE